MTSPSPRLDSLLTGSARPFTRPGSLSAIDKQPRQGPLQVTLLGIVGDEQGDLRVHGGVEKAIHHYPRDHYTDWVAELGEHPLLTRPGAFGENFSSSGWRETDVCLGDRIRVGTALLEVSQGRMPCWKLNDRFDVAQMALRVQQSGRTGWYYRVLEEGEVQAGDALQLVERPYGQWESDVTRFLRERARAAYQIVDAHLAKTPFMVGGRLTIADLSLAGYVYMPEDTGLAVGEFRHIEAWKQRIQDIPGWKHPYDLMPRAAG
ncbi:MOSC domain-containing protein [Pseudomonas soli]|uniref:MOSC domain-containing protein n=1 Tax=Pseudomonas soli TaxID=1306993 RepID=UPI002895651A|nr:MOSC domain-containing protein [Pseudomonas soli]MDT3717485.1 MOSC domain-containing protein [Pseudomonas soli]MDT3734217.1 MOSC domain-containing protein [Pseudomonas soli]